RFEGLPGAGGAAGSAVDDQVVGALGDLGIEVVHEHAQRCLGLPGLGGEGGAARRADGAGSGEGHLWLLGSGRALCPVRTPSASGPVEGVLGDAVRQPGEPARAAAGPRSATKDRQVLSQDPCADGSGSDDPARHERAGSAGLPPRRRVISSAARWTAVSQSARRGSSVACSTKVSATDAVGQPAWSRTTAATEASSAVTSPDSRATPSRRTPASSSRSSFGRDGPGTSVRAVKSAAWP